LHNQARVVAGTITCRESLLTARQRVSYINGDLSSPRHAFNIDTPTAASKPLFSAHVVRSADTLRCFAGRYIYGSLRSRIYFNEGRTKAYTRKIEKSYETRYKHCHQHEHWCRYVHCVPPMKCVSLYRANA